MIKRIIPVLLAWGLLLALPLKAAAHELPQERNDCSIEVQVRFDGEEVTGGTITAVRVGYVDEEYGSCFFSQVFTDTALADIDSVEACERLNQFYNENKDQFDFDTQTRSVENGKAVFSELATGLYLIVQETPAQGFSKMGPFLVTVPYLADGVYEYHVTVAMKSELERELATEPTTPPPTTPPPTKPDDPKLPQTGQLNWPIPLLAAAGLALIMLGCILRRQKKEHYEK